MISKQTKNTDERQIPSQKSQQGNIRPEAKLLLCCIRYQFDPAISAEITELLQTNLDWDYPIQKELLIHQG